MMNEKESMTAKLCAFARAWHSNKSREKIYDDYLAYDIMGKEEYDSIYHFIKEELVREELGFQTRKDLGVREVEEFLTNYIAPIPLSRIHFCENRLKIFTKENGIVQYVICGAGSDTFSFRNVDSNIEIYEVDHPDTQRYKLEKIKELEWNIPKNVHFVSVDFEKEKMSDNLLKAGFDPKIKTFFSILGVSYYLTLPIFSSTLEQMASLSALESVVVFDYPEKGEGYPKRVKALEEMTSRLGEQMQGGFEYNEISRVLYRLGFQIDTYLTPQKVQACYFEGRSDGLRAFENVHLVSATYTCGFNHES